MATFDFPSDQRRTSVERVLFHVFLFFAALVLIDPFYLGFNGVRVTRDLGPLKYIPIFFAVLAGFMAWVGLAFRAGHRHRPVAVLRLGRAWPLIALMLLVLAGSLWARLYGDIRETYLQIGIGLMLFPVAVLLLHAGDSEYLVARRFFQVLLLLMPCVLIWTAASRLAGGQAFHLEVFLFAPLAVYAYLAIRHPFLRAVIVMLCLGVGFAGHKNTGYLNGLIGLIYIAILAWPHRSRGRSTVAFALLIYLTAMLSLMAMAALGYVLIERENYLPSGSADVRAQTYLSAFKRFLSSPLWGNLFTDSSLHELSGITVLNSHLLISHSDLIDMLANGGLLAIGLLLAGLTVVVTQVLQALRKQQNKTERALLHGLSAIVVGGVVTSTFNSPLLTLPVGSMFWFALGLLYAVATNVVNKAESAGEPAYPPSVARY